jgi:3-hydroxyacyl-[acyl-carrier-protein] dehydratase
MRFYLVDRVLSLEKGKTAHGLKCWSLSDPFFGDHFPGFPVVPGVFLIESMAQLLGMLIEQSFSDAFPERAAGVFAMLTQVHEAKFQRMVLPGDKAEMMAKLESLDIHAARGLVELQVDGEKRASATLTFLLFDREALKNQALENQRQGYWRDVTRAFLPTSAPKN